MTTYSIWKDGLFYFYLAVFLFSAMIFVNSLRRLIDINSKEKDTEEYFEDDMDDSEQMNIENNYSDENSKEQIPVNSESNEEDKIELDSDIEKLEFKNKDILFDSSEPQIETIPDSKNINDIFEKLNKRLDEIESKIDAIEKNIFNSVKAGEIDDVERQIKDVPQYMYKFVEDLINDFENIETQKVKSRLEFLLSELKKFKEEK